VLAIVTGMILDHQKLEQENQKECDKILDTQCCEKLYDEHEGRFHWFNLVARHKELGTYRRYTWDPEQRAMILDEAATYGNVSGW
jgi:hypothetical protein